MSHTVTTFVAGISLITAFAGGMVALFAPCCITYLLPSYLANIFRSKTNVLAMTIVFGLGIGTILIPTALGIRAIGMLFTKYHTTTYVVGGIFMILLGAMELTGKKITLPMLNLTIDLTTNRNPWAVYLMGIFSGITSSCCTPVLAGVLTVSFLSPSFAWAALAGIAYVFGMVVPLVIIALLLDRIHWQQLTGLKKKTIRIGTRDVPATDAAAGVLFILVGMTFSVLALTGRITMGTETPIEQTLGTGTMAVVSFLRSLPFAEGMFAVILIAILIIIFRKGVHL